MSYCSIIVFNDGKPDDEIEFKNSYGGAAFVFDVLYNNYLKDPSIPYDHWLSGAREDNCRLWDLAKRQDIPLFERAVHASQFDWAMVRQEHFKQLAQHFRQFVEKYKPDSNRVCHLPAWAHFLESCDAEAIGFYGTSVSENLWCRWDGELDESVPYDLNAGDKHFEVYDWLEEVDEYSVKMEKMKHPDPDVQTAIVKLSDALCSYERATGRDSVLIIREQGGFEYRAVSGKPGVSDDIPDEQLFEGVK